ncbi:MAG TPA: Hpt domain-containing protein [Isosphaeraceae bacterium]|nr:Hpt domain-containing protein [Isosphaeraceae bacterium]
MSHEGATEFARELAESVLESAPRGLSGIEVALKAGHGRKPASEADGLKGISRTIGATDLAGAWQVLEDPANQGDLQNAAATAARRDAGWEQVRTILEHFSSCQVAT